MQSDAIIYEQPLNEHIRACLRLEHLFQQIEATINYPTQWASRSALQSLLKIVNVVDRPDLKGKLTKALSQHASILTQFENLPQVNSSKCREMLDTLDEVIDQLYATNGKIGQRLHDNDFLSSVKSHMHNPGGPCNFSIPAYQLWLNQSAEKRSQDLNQWHAEFKLVGKAVTLLLQLTREFTKPETKTAESGFFQQSLDASAQGEMIRVIVPNKLTYPEISVGRHRLSIRFYDADILAKPKQSNDNINFKLLYCSL